MSCSQVSNELLVIIPGYGVTWFSLFWLRAPSENMLATPGLMWVVCVCERSNGAWKSPVSSHNSSSRSCLTRFHLQSYYQAICFLMMYYIVLFVCIEQHSTAQCFIPCEVNKLNNPPFNVFILSVILCSSIVLYLCGLYGFPTELCKLREHAALFNTLFI